MALKQAVTPEGKLITVRGPNKRSIVVTVAGITPLLTKRISERSSRKISGQVVDRDEESVWTDEDEFSSSVYRTSDQQPAVPGAAFRCAMVDAGRSADIPMTVLKQVFAVAGDMLPVWRPRGEERDHHEPVVKIDFPRNKVKQALTVSYRAMYECPWEVDVPLRYNANKIAHADLLSLLELAGFAVGVGVYRMECMGVFGQFEVVRYAVLEVKQDG